MSAPRRSSRPLRAVVAVALLGTAFAAGVTAIAIGTVAVLAVAVGYALVSSSVAARLLADETGHVRREWARDRAAIAQQHSRDARTRGREQVAFADAMAERVRAGHVEAARLRAEVQAAEAALADAEQRLSVEHEALLAARAEVRALRDELAASQSVEIELRAELVAWQQREDSRRYA